MKKKIGIIGLALLLITLVYQGTMAVMQESTNVNSKMSAAKLGVAIVQNDAFGKDAEKEVTFDKVMPGATVEHDLKVENTKDKDVYIRVTLTKYWVDEKGKKQTSADAALINTLSNWTDWIVVDDAENSNNEVMYFYYKKPVKANEATTSFLRQVQCSTKIEDNIYAKYSIKLDVDVEAVQTVGAKDAILSEWGMNVTIDENNNIVSVEE